MTANEEAFVVKLVSAMCVGVLETVMETKIVPQQESIDAITGTIEREATHALRYFNEAQRFVATRY